MYYYMYDYAIECYENDIGVTPKFCIGIIVCLDFPTNTSSEDSLCFIKHIQVGSILYTESDLRDQFDSKYEQSIIKMLSTTDKAFITLPCNKTSPMCKQSKLYNDYIPENTIVKVEWNENKWKPKISFLFDTFKQTLKD